MESHFANKSPRRNDPHWNVNQKDEFIDHSAIMHGKDSHRNSGFRYNADQIKHANKHLHQIKKDDYRKE